MTALAKIGNDFDRDMYTFPWEQTGRVKDYWSAKGGEGGSRRAKSAEIDAQRQ